MCLFLTDFWKILIYSFYTVNESFVTHLYWEISTPARVTFRNIFTFKNNTKKNKTKDKIIHVRSKADLSLHPEVNLTHKDTLNNANGAFFPH